MRKLKGFLFANTHYDKKKRSNRLFRLFKAGIFILILIDLQFLSWIKARGWMDLIFAVALAMYLYELYRREREGGS